MRILKTVAVIIAFTVLDEQTKSSCMCHNLKDDSCLCNKSIPRPQIREASKQSVSNIFQTNSACSCGQTLVRPASPPRPLCSTINLASGHLAICKEKNIRAPDLLQGATVQPKSCYMPETPETHIIADAVSLSLAYQMAKNRKEPVPETKLQYGFQMEPISNLNHIARQSVPEEKLWTTNRAVVELKTADIINSPESAEDEEEFRKLQVPEYLTYKDIGYCPEKQAIKAFDLKLPSLTLDTLCANPPEATSDSRCGFRPGKITFSENYNLRNKVPCGIEECFDNL